MSRGIRSLRCKRQLIINVFAITVFTVKVCYGELITEETEFFISQLIYMYIVLELLGKEQIDSIDKYKSAFLCKLKFCDVVGFFLRLKNLKISTKILKTNNNSSLHV